MKTTKRMKNALLQAFIVNLFFIIIFSWVLFFHSYPTAKTFFSMKEELEDVSNRYQQIKQNGLSIWDVRKVANSKKLNSDIVIREVLTDFSPQLFLNTFTNTWSLEYVDFLEQVNDNVVLQKQSPEYIAGELTLNKVLPIYSSGNNAGNILSDFYFINYIEKLLYTFNLSGVDSIWISSLQKVEDSIANDEGMPWEQIYKIPLTLSVVGRKKDIVEFVHFFENVGSVFISDASIKQYSDDFLEKVIEWQQSTEEYNIYKNQLSIIESITFPEYPDSWTTISGEDIVSTMLKNQATQRLEAEINISFFVSGIPTYQVKTYIDEFYSNFDILSEKINILSKKVSGEKGTYTDSSMIESVTKIQSLNTLMLLFLDEIEWKRWVEANDLNDSSFESFTAYSSKLKRIEEAFLELEQIFTVK